MTGVTSLSGCAEFLDNEEETASPTTDEDTPTQQPTETTTETPGEPNIIIEDHNAPDTVNLRDELTIEYTLRNNGEAPGETDIGVLIEEFNSLDSGSTVLEDSVNHEVGPKDEITGSFTWENIRDNTIPGDHSYTLTGPNNQANSEFEVGISEEFSWNDVLYGEEISLSPADEQLLDWFFGQVDENNVVGQDLSFDASDRDIISYSHGGDYFDVNHFQETSFENAIQDLTTLMACKRASQKGDFGISGSAQEIGTVAEEAFEQLRNETTYWTTTTDGHGFWPVIASEEHGYYMADTNTDLQGRPWNDPFENRNVSSPITQYQRGHFEIGGGSSANADGTDKLQRILDEFSVIHSYPSQEHGLTGVNAPLLEDAVNEFYSEGNENLWRIKPAMAVLAYQKLIDDGKHHVLRADSWSDLPEYNPESNQDFSQYREQVESNILTLENEDEFSEYYFGEKT